MNTAIKAGIAGALVLAGVAAHASIAQPASGTSDAILFAEVTNASGAVIASYAGDTGYTIAQLTSISGSSTVLGSDSNLAALFAADASGDHVLFSVQGGQWPSSGSATAQAGQYITTVSSNNTSQLSNINGFTLANNWQGIDTDVSNVNSNISSFSTTTNSVEGGTTGNAGIWDTTNISGVAYWDGGSTATANDASTGKQNLYYVTAGSALASGVNYKLEGTASLSSTGLVIAGNTSTVPLPAAVWLLGSGLLGLTGVARRKAKA